MIFQLISRRQPLSSIIKNRSHLLGVSTSRLKHASTRPTRALPAQRSSTAKHLKENVVKPSSSGGTEEVIYKRTPAWYMRNWIWLLIGADIVWTGNGVDMIFNKWTREAEAQIEGQPKTYEDRPIWQRSATSAFVIVGGVCLAAGMLLMQRRVVRRVALSNGGKTVSIECAAHRKGRGFVVPKSACEIKTGRDDTEMIMRIKGHKGSFWLNLNDAIIAGDQVGNWEAKKRLHEKWFGVHLIGRWSGGSPTVQGAWM